MKGRLRRALTITTLGSLLAAPWGCGYFLHPERRGQQSGNIDGATMVMDLLWLLPGIIPGVIALIVDFSSGAIYVHGSHALQVPPGGQLAVRLPGTSHADRIELRLVTASRRLVARSAALIGPGHSDDQILPLEVGGRAAGTEPLYLEIVSARAGAARLATPIVVTPGN